MTSSVTMNNVITRLSNQYSVVVNAISLKPTVVSVVMHHFNILCGMMARNNRSFYAKYVSLDLNQTQTADSPKLTF